MKRPIIVLLSVCACLFAVFLISQPKKTLHSVFENEKEEFENEEESEKEAGIDKEMMAWFQARAYPDPYNLSEKYARAWQQVLKLKERSNSLNSRTMAANWVSLGPSTGIGGRILCVEVNPVKPTTLYAGSASGGIWRSYDGGANWKPVATNTYVLGVTSIIINPADTMTIYAGTGEVYRMDTTASTPNPGNIGLNVWKARGTYSIGILKSTDGGNTWSVVCNKYMRNLFGIQRLRFNPNNYNTVYACTTNGLYRSYDGTNWTNILNLPYVSDVVINAKDTNQIVAASGNFSNTLKGIWRSVNGGSAWAKITVGSLNFATVQGFTRLDNVPSLGNRDTILASIGICETPSGTNELYRSTDFGATWTALGSSSHTQWQYWCAHDVAINPFASDSVLLGGVKSVRYRISTATKSATFSVHDDVHDMKFDPLTRGTAYICCDGGIYKTTNGGVGWSQIDNGLAATQFYANVGVSPAGAANNVIIGGLQDNGVWWSQDGGTTWGTYPGGYGDGASCLIDPNNGNNILASGDARNFTVSTNGGSTTTTVLSYLASGAPTTTHDSRTAFVAPAAYSKKKSTVVYVGTDNLHKSTDGGATWTNNVTYSGNTTPSAFIEAVHKTAICIAVSPTDPNGDTLYVSTSNFAQFDNDQDGLWVSGQPNLLKSTNGGTTLPMTSVKGTLPNRFVLDITMSPTYHDSVYVTLGGFGTQHIYVSPDGGTTWNALGYTLPDVPFNSLVFDPVNPKIIYAACDLGVYVSSDRGINWADFNTGFWDATQVVDLQIDKNNKLLAVTHGKGIFRSNLFTGSTLPVSIMSFTGEVLSASNNLKWEVGQELNISHYEVERSSDGNNFQKIGTVRAVNSATYRYTDASVYNSSYYYRLKIVENDGSISYSETIYLKRNSKDAMQIMQNPFTSDLRIQLSVAQNSKARINLYDAGGKLLRSRNIALQQGQTMYTINDLTILPAGAYYVEAIVNNRQWREKVIKK